MGNLQVVKSAVHYSGGAAASAGASTFGRKPSIFASAASANAKASADSKRDALLSLRDCDDDEDD